MQAPCQGEQEPTRRFGGGPSVRHRRRVAGRAGRPGPFTGVLPEALALLDASTLARMDDDLGAPIDLLHTDERAAGIPLAQM